MQAEIGDHYFGCAILEREGAAKVEKPRIGIGDEVRKPLQRRFRKIARDDLIALLIKIEGIISGAASQIDDRGIFRSVKNLTIFIQPIIVNGPLRSMILKYNADCPVQ